jgi:hypothetical protein
VVGLAESDCPSQTLATARTQPFLGGGRRTTRSRLLLMGELRKEASKLQAECRVKAERCVICRVEVKPTTHDDHFVRLVLHRHVPKTFRGFAAVEGVRSANNT